MTTSASPKWQPDWAVAPGEILLEALQDRDLTQSELAQRLGRPLKTINEIIKGKAAITADTAIQLERTLGISASFWTNLETQYRDALARQRATAELESQTSWADRFPIVELVRRGLIERGPTKAATVENLLSWLGLGSPAAFDRIASSVSYRKSPAFMASPEAVTAWLRWGELQASATKAATFDLDRFRGVLRAVRPLTRKEPFAQIFRRVQKMCAEAGVVVVLTPELPGTHVSGAARWVGSHALIQLSLRHKTDDELWFTFFHEAGHICSGRRRYDAVDGPLGESTVDPEEVAVDGWARDFMLEPDAYRNFRQAGDFSVLSVRRFAETQSIAPGIVVGFLERDELVTHGQLRRLKKPVNFSG